MKYLLAILVLIASAGHAASPYFNVRQGGGSSGGGGTTSPGGAPTNLQYNNSGSFGGVSGSSVGAQGSVSLSSVGINTGLAITGNINDYHEVNLRNASSGASASTDFIATADNGTSSTFYVDLGINGSGGGTAPFTGANAAYLYTDQGMLNIGALAASGTITFNVSGSTAAPIEAARIVSTGNVGIGTSTPATKLEVAGIISTSGVSVTGSVTATQVRIGGPGTTQQMNILSVIGSTREMSFQPVTSQGVFNFPKNTGTNQVKVLTEGAPGSLGGLVIGTTVVAGATASATIQITSGSLIVGTCNTGNLCGTSQLNAQCYSTVKKTIALCDGAASWIPLVSTTIVSASAL